MRALVLATLLFLAAAAPAQAAPATAEMDYWQYMATFATEEECHEEGAKIPDGVDYYVCWPDSGEWDFYWVFLT
ncbi:MAG: hypothetical protein HOV94_17980 [Saccharothrix sp.]|nr:hypothetical protein [Saccharothrix sp.]